MQVGEQDEIRTQEIVLLRQRLLDLEHELRVAPHALGRCQCRAGVSVEVVGQARAESRTVLDEHRVSVRRQRARAGWREGHPILLVLDLARNADDHALRV